MWSIFKRKKRKCKKHRYQLNPARHSEPFLAYKCSKCGETCLWHTPFGRAKAMGL